MKKTTVSWIPAFGSHGILVTVIAFAFNLHATRMPYTGLPGTQPGLQLVEWFLISSLLIGSIIAVPVWIILICLSSFRPSLGAAMSQMSIYLLGLGLTYGFLLWDPWHTISWWFD
jgi:hypothetical protein